MKQKLLFSLSLLFLTGQLLAQNVGIGTTTPAARLHVTDSSVLFSAPGYLPFPQGLPPASGEGRRMMWYPDKAAFRAGYIANSGWDYENIGEFSFAVGQSSVASNTGTVAMGWSNYATGYGAQAFGFGAEASGDLTVAAGNGAVSKAYASFSCGQWNDSVAGSSKTVWLPQDPLFIVGNGTTPTVRSNAMIVLKNGDVGIGNIIPSQKLEVDGNSLFRNDITVNGTAFLTAINQEALQTPSLINGWVNYGTGFANASFYKDKEGVVHIKGLIKDGTALSGTVLFNLPVGYRPSSGLLIFEKLSNNVLGRVDVLPNGNVVILNGSSAWVNLTGISFRAD